MKQLIVFVLICLLIFVAYMGLKQSKEIQIAKQQPRSDGVKSIEELSKEDDYFVVKSADMHNVGGDLLARKITARGVVTDTKTDLGGKNLLVLVEGDCYFLQVVYESSSRIPDDLRNQIEKGGIQKGSTIQIWGMVDKIAPETGFNKSILRYKSCFIKSVDKWSR
jgi:DNA/RNA endonuclease YhcR with UshA esterase domain